MAPGQRQDLTRIALQQAQKSAEALFESKSIADIKKVENQTRKDIDGKKLQLRQTVGQSYHELITSADMIKSMSDECSNVVDDLSSIRGVFADLAKALTTTRAAPTATQHGMSDAQLELYAIGSRVKFLVDTPEALWGLLDSKQPLVAARRLRAAMLVHTRLTEARSRALSRQFPLLRARWSTTTSKQRDILSCANDILQTATRIDKMAEAVTAVCLLEDLTSETALDHFLEQRKAAIANFAASATPSSPAGPQTPAVTPPSGGLSSQALIQHAQETAAMIQNVLFHVVLLFGEDDPLDYLMTHAAGGGVGTLNAMSPMATGGTTARALWNTKSFNPRGTAQHMSPWVSTGQPLVQQALSADSHASAELLFDPFPGSEADAQSEVQLWDAQLAQQMARMGSVPQEKLRSVCSAWLVSLPGAAPHLLAAAGSCADLAAVAAGVRAALPGWTAPPPGGGGAAAAAAAAAGSAAAVAAPWPAIAAAVLARGVDIWEAVFEPCMLKRADALASKALHAATRSMLSVLADSCAAAAAAAADAAGAGAGAAGASAWGAAHSAAAPWRARVPEARAALDAAVTTVLADSMHLLPAADSGQVRTRMEERRADAIESRVHEACVSCMMELASDLQQLFSKVPATVDARLVEELLLIGRMAHEVAHCSASLPLALAPLAAWPAATSAPAATTPLAPAAARPLRGAPAAAAAARMRSVRERLDVVAAGSFAAWARWASAALGERLSATLLQESALTAASKPKKWRKCIMDSLSAATAAELGEVSFQLPAEPLAATLALLLASTRELQRAGGPQLPPLARQCLAGELQAAAAKSISNITTDPSSPLGASLSEPGTIQLIFDAHLLSCAFTDAAGPNSITPAAGDTTNPVLEASRAAQASQKLLEQQLVSKLDPIDWATYEKYLKGNVRDCLARKSLLVGLLVAAAPVQDTVGAGGSAARPKQAGEEDDLLEATPACARLPLLPISMPHIDSAAIAAQAPAAGAAGLASAAAATSAAYAPARLAARISGAAAAAASAAGAGSAGAPAAAVAAAGGAGGTASSGALPQAADLCAAYSFANLTLSKPLDAAFAENSSAFPGDSAAARAIADSDAGVAGAAMATFESLGAKISGSAGSAFGGVGLNVTAVQEQLGQFGGSFSSVLGQPSGANSNSFFNSSFFGSAFRSGTNSK